MTLSCHIVKKVEYVWVLSRGLCKMEAMILIYSWGTLSEFYRFLLKFHKYCIISYNMYVSMTKIPVDIIKNRLL